MKEFYDFEVDLLNGGYVLILHHNEKSKKVKDTFNLQDIIMPYLKKKGWQFK